MMSSVITFNHDLVIENDIFKRARLRHRWCLSEGYGTMEGGLGSLTSSATEPFDRHSPDCDHSRPISIHKLHGSLNWIFRLRSRRPTSNQLTGRAAPPELFLTYRRHVLGRLSTRRVVEGGEGEPGTRGPSSSRRFTRNRASSGSSSQHGAMRERLLRTASASSSSATPFRPATSRQPNCSNVQSTRTATWLLSK